MNAKVSRSPERSTEKQIYRAAVNHFAAFGYHGASLRKVATDVGVKMATLYYHFESKQDLLLRIMSQTMTDLIDQVEVAVRDVPHAADRLTAAIHAHVMFHAERQQEAFITDSELRALEPEPKKDVVALRDQYESIFVEVIDNGVKAKVFREVDPRLAAFGLLAMCTGVATWYRPDGRLSLEEIAKDYADYFLSGLLP